MESANIHQLHQDQLVGSPSPSSSSSLPTPSSCYGLVSSTSTHAWIPTPNVTLNASNMFNQSYGVILNSNSPMIQESAGLHWINNQSAHDHFAKIKEEFSDSFPKFTEMLNCSPSSNIEDSDFTTTSYLKNHEQNNLNDLSNKLFLKTISSGFPINWNNDQFSAGDFYSSSGSTAMPSRGNFSQIYPSINISNLNQSSSPATSSSFDMNLQALDLLTSARFSRDFSQPSHDNLGLCKENPFGLDHLPQSSRRPSCSPSNKISHFTNFSEITEATKRPSGLMQPKATQSASKKTRLESRASCPPFKVRKEKLGDRIAALQQMVAPFGKTDTASVLMEAIGYIKFLQNQIETLSVPYMKSSRNKSSRTVQGGSVADVGDEEPRRDLRSRGLCLVPLSCMSYVTNDAAGGGGIWPPPPNFGGET